MYYYFSTSDKSYSYKASPHRWNNRAKNNYWHFFFWGNRRQKSASNNEEESNIQNDDNFGCETDKVAAKMFLKKTTNLPSQNS